MSPPASTPDLVNCAERGRTWFRVLLHCFLIINQTSCYNEATGPDKHEKFNTTNTYYHNKRKILITFIFGNGSKCGGMCFICFIWVIKQELLPTRRINLLTNNYIQCFFLAKEKYVQKQL